MQTKELQIREFYNDKLASALKDCQRAGYRALFIPEIADLRISGKASWNQWYSAPSIRATGRTSKGTAVVVYAHIPNYFSRYANIQKAVKAGLINRAGIMPQSSFRKLLSKEDGSSVFVIDHKKLAGSKSCEIPLDSALEHPQVIPFLGGEKRAEEYLNAHRAAYKTNTIGVWYRDDLRDETLARLLFVGHCINDGLIGNDVLDFNGRFLGVRKEVAEGDAQKCAQSEIYIPEHGELANCAAIAQGVRDGTRPAQDLEQILSFLGKFRKK